MDTSKPLSVSGRFVFATRKSPLALAQSRAFGAALVAANPGTTLEELHVVTSGDRIQDRPLYEVGGKGLFVKEIEEAMLEGRADFAVHSIKDVPSALPPGLKIVCMPKRVDARDVLVCPKFGTLANLPKGAKVGTSSLRRKWMLLRARPDLEIVPLRGNVDTRLRKVVEGEMDAIVLAAAGVERLGVELPEHELLSTTVSLPAIGQGALGIEAKEGDLRVHALLASLHDRDTELCVSAERGVLTALNGDCRTPIAAYARVSRDGLVLESFRCDIEGTNPRALVENHKASSVEEAFKFGLEHAKRLLGA